MFYVFEERKELKGSLLTLQFMFLLVFFHLSLYGNEPDEWSLTISE